MQCYKLPWMAQNNISGSVYCNHFNQGLLFWITCPACIGALFIAWSAQRSNLVPHTKRSEEEKWTHQLLLLAWFHKRTTETTNGVKYLREYFKIPQPTTPKQFANYIVTAFLKDADVQLDTGGPGQLLCLAWKGVGGRGNPKKSSPWNTCSKGQGAGTNNHEEPKGRSLSAYSIPFIFSSRNLAWCCKQWTETLPRAMLEAFSSPLPCFCL